MEPPLPLNAEPVTNVIEPLLPSLVDPVLTNTAPEMPLDTAFADDTVTDPVELLDDPPLWIKTTPPVSLAEVVPADRTTAPPAPLLPLPTTRLMEPPLPPAAVPDTRSNSPVFPDELVPLLSVNEPEDPVEIAFADANTSVPVVPLFPLAPESTETEPPSLFDAVVVPA